MGAVAKLARIGVVVGAVTLGALAGAMPAQAAASWTVAVSCTGDVILPGEPGDLYTFTFASPACKDGSGVFVYVYNQLTVGGNTTGSGFLGRPTNYAFFYNYTANASPTGWQSSGLNSGTFALQSMSNMQLLTTNLAGQSLGGAGSRVGALSFGALQGPFFDIYWGTTPSGGGGSAAAPAPTFTLTSNSTDRGSCWPTVSGLGGVWVQLTATGCAPPSGRGDETLLGWATSPAFPVDRARNQVAVDEYFSGVRMIFIPLNGYTLMSGDNTMYPIWSN